MFEIAIGLFKALSASKQGLRILAVLLVLGAIGYGVKSYFDLRDAVTAANDKLVTASERETALQALLDDQKAETTRVNGLLSIARAMRVDAEPIYVERKVEVVKYRDNPAITHVSLSAEWVRIHNQAALYPYATP